MKRTLLAAVFTLGAIGGASAQMAPPPPPGAPAPAPMAAPMAPMMGDTMQKSCVSGGQFVACPPAGGMQPGMADGKMAMKEPMKRRTAMKTKKKKKMM